MTTTQRPHARTFDYKKYPDRTHQSFKDECDINKIMARIIKTGVDPFADRAACKNFIDCTAIPDFREAQDHINKMYSYFDSLPSKVRLRFDNDPSHLVSFLSNLDANMEEAELLGLVSKQKPIQKQQEAVAGGATKAEPASADGTVIT